MFSWHLCPRLCSSDAFDLQYGVGILRMREGLGMGLDHAEATIFNDPNEPTPPLTDDG